jgi:RNA polymerase sigma-70 factor, ECF subfamily
VSSKEKPLSTASAVTTSEACESIVNLILAGDPRGEELLYSTFSRGLRFLAAKHCPEYADDCAHDAILTVTRQIRQGQLKTPAALPGYLNIVLKRTAWNKKMEAERLGANDEVFTTVVQTHSDDRNNPQRLLEIQERAQILREGLASLKPQEREILTRFYLKGQRPEEICEAMGLTDTQFRLNKSRSKQKLEAFTAKRLRSTIRPVRPSFARAAVCS